MKTTRKLIGILCVLLETFHASSQNVQLFKHIPSSLIQVSASSSLSQFPASAAIDGSGMQNNTHASHNLGRNMWISKPSTQRVRTNKQTHEGIVWLLMELKSPSPAIDLIQIWNHNQNQHTRRGLKKVYIEYSSDGQTWQVLKNKELDYHIINQSQGKVLEPADFSLETSGIKIKYLCITADFDQGNYYHDNNSLTLREAADMSQDIHYYGLSEVRLYQKTTVPVATLEPIRKISFAASQGYLRTTNGPTREYTVQLDTPLYCGGKLIMEINGKQQIESIPPNPLGITTFAGKFPSGYMEMGTDAMLYLNTRQGSLKEQVHISGARQWTLFFLPHSHQDIGYTHHQDDVMKLQWRNLERAMELSERSADYPVGARFKWNSEATWSVKGYLDHYQGTDKSKKLIKAIQNGSVGVDAPLGSILTGICKQEELMHVFDDAHQITKLTGVESNTAMMSDVPGQSWGFVTALAQNGIKYFSSAPNYVPFWGKTGCDRAAILHVKWGDVPFYWQSESGTDKVLVWQTGKGYSWFHGWLIDRLSSCGITPIWEYLADLETKEFPYSITHLRYTVNGDNGPPDELMPDVIKEWNEKYESPQFRIGTTKELFTEFEAKYGIYLPVYSGDMTPVWEDGAASTARELAMNRESSERLNQTEIVWSILNPKKFPANDFLNAWKNIILFSEHTWGASASGPEPESQFTKDLWQTKKSYADSADIQSKRLYDKAFESWSANRSGKQYIHVFNTNAWIRTDVVKIRTEMDLNGKVLIPFFGEQVPVQKMNDGTWIFLAKNIPPIGSVVFRIEDDKRKNTANKSFINNNIMDNGFVRLEVDKTTGTISSLSAIGEEFNYAAEHGLNDYIYSGKMAANIRKVERIKQIIPLNDGEVAATIRIESDAPGCRSLWRDITIYKDLGRIDICNTMDKLNVFEQERVRFAFSFNISNAEISMDLAMSEIHPERNQLAGSNKNFYSIQNGLSVHNLSHGIYLTTVDAPFIELGEMTAEDWKKEAKGLGWMPSSRISPMVYSWVMNNSWRTNYKASQEGLATFRYSLELADPFQMQLKKQGSEQAQKLLGIVTDNSNAITSMFKLKGFNEIAVSTIKPSEDGTGYIIRLQNLSNQSVHSKIEWGRTKAEKVYQCDNKEQISSSFDDTSFWLKPYECITIKAII